MRKFELQAICQILPVSSDVNIVNTFYLSSLIDKVKIITSSVSLQIKWLLKERYFKTVKLREKVPQL